MDALIEAIKAFIFGVVEGITEWLPISSTGHMMLLNQFLPLNVSEAFYDTFLVVIQLGAIMAVIMLYFHKLNPFSVRKSDFERKETWGIWAKVVIGSIPAATIGFLLDDWMEEHVTNNPQVAYVVVSLALIIYGVIFILLERRNRKKLAAAQFHVMGSMSIPHDRIRAKDDPELRGRHAKRGDSHVMWVDAASNDAADIEPAEQDSSNAFAKINTFDEMSYKTAFLIGIFQSLAIIPGTSRSGSTIIGSMLLGTSRTIATEFAFFLAIPIMFGWSLLKFIRHGFAYTGIEWMIFAIGIITAFVVSVLAIKFLIGYIKQNDFTAFGFYRIGLGFVVLVYFGLKALGLF